MGESSKKKSSRSIATQRAWSLVRMALLWGRKGGIFKKMSWHHMYELRNLFSKHLKTLNLHGIGNNNDNDRSLSRYYGEKQLSFDETPIFKHRTASMRFLLPCIAVPVDFDYDFALDGGDDEVSRSYGYYDERCDRAAENDCEEKEEEEEKKSVDLRAEEFIANFYKQMKLQRQISYLEYTKEQHNDVV